MNGLDVLGAIKPEYLLTLRVNNPRELAERQAREMGSLHGAGATVFSRLAPEVLEAEVYRGVASEMVSEFRKKGGDVTVRVVDSTKDPVLHRALGGAPSADLSRKSTIPIGAIGLGAVLGGVLSWLIFRRKKQ